MSIEEIHVISENDLQGMKKSGTRIRARCPIHGSRDRDLSIAPAQDEYFDEDAERLAGFGFCHSANCGATVLVQEWNPKAAVRILGRPIQVREPRVKMSSAELEKAEEWQRRELAALEKIYPASLNLKHVRAFAYLAQRGLQSQEAQDLLTSLGGGYIPPAEEWKQEPPAALRKWCDRIIFPYRCSNGERGFIGRTLYLWEPGMDESEHKRLLLAYEKHMEEEHQNQAYKYLVRRYEKTYKSGFMNAEVMGQYDHLYITEGPFDAIPLMLAGLPGVVAIAGTHIDVNGIPKNVFDVTLAFDSDMQGKNAIAKTTDLLGGAGITPVFLVPPDDGRGKDWSERYRRCGVDGLSVLLEADRRRQTVTVEPDLAEPDLELQSDQVEALDTCAVCGAVMLNQYTEEEAENSTRDFFYVVEDDAVVCYCTLCCDMETGERLVSARVEESASGEQSGESAEHEQFMRVVNDISQLFGGCTITVDPPGYTLAEHVKRLQHEEAQRIRDAQIRAAAWWS